MKKVLDMKFNKKQDGAVLIVGLLILLLTTMVALSSMQNSNLQEKMATNSQEDNRAFQAAESIVEVYREGIDDVDKEWMVTAAINQFLLKSTDWPQTSGSVYDSDITTNIELELIGEDAPACLAQSLNADLNSNDLPCYSFQFRSTSSVTGSNATVTVVQGFTLNL